MEISFARAWVRQVALGLAAVVLAGCATMAASPEAAVKARATDYWKARIAADYEKAYGFMPPSYRAVTSLDRYKGAFGAAAQLTSAEVDEVKCEATDRCVVTSKLEAKIALQRAKVPPVVTFFDETWIQEGGQWWLFPTQ